MTIATIDGFDYSRLSGADGTVLHVAHAGRGTPIALLHGFPQTHLMCGLVRRPPWRRCARPLVRPGPKFYRFLDAGR